MNPFGAAILGGLGHALEQDSLRQKEAEKEAREMRKIEANLLKEQNLARFKHGLSLGLEEQKHDFAMDRLRAVDDYAQGKEVRDRAVRLGDEQRGRSHLGYTENNEPVFTDKQGNLYLHGEHYTGPVFTGDGSGSSTLVERVAMLEQLGATPDEIKGYLLGNSKRDSPFIGTPTVSEDGGSYHAVASDGRLVTIYSEEGARFIAKTRAGDWADEKGKGLFNRRPSKDEIAAREEEEFRSIMANQARHLGQPGQASFSPGQPSILGEIPIGQGSRGENSVAVEQSSVATYAEAIRAAAPDERAALFNQIKGSLTADQEKELRNELGAGIGAKGKRQGVDWQKLNKDVGGASVNPFEVVGRGTGAAVGAGVKAVGGTINTAQALREGLRTPPSDEDVVRYKDARDKASTDVEEMFTNPVGRQILGWARETPAEATERHMKTRGTVSATGEMRYPPERLDQFLTGQPEEVQVQQPVDQDGRRIRPDINKLVEQIMSTVPEDRERAFIKATASLTPREVRELRAALIAAGMGGKKK